MLLRLTKRQTSWESNDENIVYQAEFELGDGTPDLNVSTYDVPAYDAVAVVLEHCAAGNMERVPPRSHVDFSQGAVGAQVVATEENDWFTRARTTHREVRFATLEAVRAAIRETLLALQSGSSILVPVDRAVASSFLEELRAAGGEEWAEWERFFEAHPNGPRYRKLLK